MTIKEKLQILLKLSELTQEELAHRLGVTFAALNRWINGRAVPRKKAQIKMLKNGYLAVNICVYKKEKIEL